MSAPPSDVRCMSRALSYLLRHGAAREGLKMTADGYVAVNDLIEHFRTKGRKAVNVPADYWTEENFRRVVRTDAKGRFKLIEGDGARLLIRAEQGHSVIVDDDLLLTRITKDTAPQYPTIVHGTTLTNWRQIQEEGILHAGSRRHIHFASGRPDDATVRSGVRRSAEVFVYIDMVSAIEEGWLFYISGNKVILCAGLPQGIEKKPSRDLPLKFVTKVEFTQKAQ